jgi:hypothetical protein
MNVRGGISGRLREGIEGLFRYLYHRPLSTGSRERKGGVAPGHAGDHARSAERFILMCGRAGTSVPPAAVSPATQAPSPLPHPVSTRSIVRQAREPQGWTQGSSSRAAGQGCMTTLAISVAVSTRLFLLVQGETCDALAVVSPDSPTGWHGYLEQCDIHQARPRPVGGPVRRLPICAG